MRKYFGICSLLLMVIMVLASINPANCFARQKYQHELTHNSHLGEANDLYKEAIQLIKDGDGVHESQRAAQLYAGAESYLTKTILKLKELGLKHDIDVSKEVEFCEKLQRETHSKQGIAKRESK